MREKAIYWKNAEASRGRGHHEWVWKTSLGVIAPQWINQ